MPAIDPKPFIDAAACAFSCIPSGMVWYAILAGLIDLANGKTVTTDTDALMAEATCLQSCIPQGYLPYVILLALTQISGGSGTSCLFCHTAADPSGVPPCDCALWIRKDNSKVWYWDSDIPDWVALIA